MTTGARSYTRLARRQCDRLRYYTQCFSDGRAQQQLLPLAEARNLQGLAPPAA